jgi:hypothetical protein
MAKEPDKNAEKEAEREAEKAGREAAKAERKEEAAPKPVEPTEPYPTGSPPDPEDAFEAAHGFRREKPKE